MSASIVHYWPEALALIVPPLVAGYLLATHRQAWLRQPLVFTRGHALFTTYVIAGLLGLALVIGYASITGLANEKAHRADEERRALAAELRRESLSKADVSRIAGRVARLEKPTTKELLALIRRASLLCAAHRRECEQARAAGRRALRRLEQRKGAATSDKRADGGGGGGGLPAPVPRTPRPGGSSTPAPTGGSSGSGSGGSSGSSPAPSKPPAAVQVTPPTITTPIGTVTLPPACVSGVVDLNHGCH